MEDIALLKKLEFFKGLDILELTKINTIVKRAAFRKGQDIVNEKTPCDALYIVKSGKANVTKDGRKIAVLGPGSPLGEVAFIDKGQRSATVTAVQDTVLIMIPAEEFDDLMKREKEISSKVYKSIALLLCKRLRETNESLLMPEG